MSGAALYSLFIGALFSIAALTTEKAAALRSWPRRGIWIVAMLLSLALPAHRLMNAQPGTSPFERQKIMEFSASPSASSTFAVTTRAPSVAVGKLPANHSENLGRSQTDEFFVSIDLLESIFPYAWLSASAAILLALSLAWARVQQRSKRWQSTKIDGNTVLLAEKFGPAVFGIIRPQIVVPRRLLDNTPEIRALAFAHETSHIQARDPLLLLCGLLLVVLFPWNLPLWWQFRRLRFAIEVDCDARVVHRGIDARTYGHALLELGQRHSQSPLGALALIERPSQLERRIRIMLSDARRYTGWLIAGLLLLTTSLVIGATTVDAPVTSSAAAAAANAKWLAEQGQRMQHVSDALIREGSADSLAAAAMMRSLAVFFKPSNEPLTLISRATASAPKRADLAWLELSLCVRLGSCDPEPLAARLRTLDSDNGAAAIYLLEKAEKQNNSVAAQAALLAMSRSQRIDLYFTGLVGHLANALVAQGEFNSSQAVFLSGGLLGAIATPPFKPIFKACAKDRVLAPTVLETCRAVGHALRKGDTLIAESVGIGLTMRLWPVGSLEYQSAISAQRTLKYQNAQVGAITSRRMLWSRLPSSYWRSVTARYLNYRREQDFDRAELLEAGVDLNPPPHWLESR